MCLHLRNHHALLQGFLQKPAVPPRWQWDTSLPSLILLASYIPSAVFKDEKLYRRYVEVPQKYSGRRGPCVSKSSPLGHRETEYSLKSVRRYQRIQDRGTRSPT